MRLRHALVPALLIFFAPAEGAEVTPERLMHAEAEPQNWLMNHHTYDSHRYSPLDRITKENVRRLKLEYALPIGNGDAGANLQATPLAEDGFLYVVEQSGA